MARLLIAWEMGANAGHLRHLGVVGSAMRAAGHEVVLASRNVGMADRMLGHLGLTVVKAPSVSEVRSGVPPSSLSYAEMLHSVGYGREGPGLADAVARWRELLAGAHGLISEQSPTARLAAWQLGIPDVAVGDGFSCPPPGSSFVPWREREGDMVDGVPSHVRWYDRAVAVGISKVLNVPLSWLDYSIYPKDPLVLAIPELDHYGPRREAVSYWGNMPTPGQAEAFREAPWPDTARGGGAVFAFMYPWYPGFKEAVSSLRRSHLPTLLVAPGVAPWDVAALETRDLRVVPDYVDVRSLAKVCAVSLNTSSAGVNSELLAMGIPSVLLPVQKEQDLLAHRLEAQGLGARCADPRKVQLMLRGLLENREVRDRAAAIRHRESGPGGDRGVAVTRLAETIASRLGLARAARKPTASVTSISAESQS